MTTPGLLRGDMVGLWTPDFDPTSFEVKVGVRLLLTQCEYNQLRIWSGHPKQLTQHAACTTAKKVVVNPSLVWCAPQRRRHMCVFCPLSNELCPSSIIAIAIRQLDYRYIINCVLTFCWPYSYIIMNIHITIVPTIYPQQKLAGSSVRAILTLILEAVTSTRPNSPGYLYAKPNPRAI